MNGRYTPDDVGSERPPRAVTFEPGAVAPGFLVGVTTLSLAYIISIGPTSGFTWDDVPGMVGSFLLLLWWGAIVGVFTGLPLRIALGLLLRPVRNQWIHVAVFFIGFAVVSLLVLPRVLNPWAVPASLPIALVVGGAGALARAGVWRTVRIYGI